MYIRRRNYENGRIKRNNRRIKSNESFHFIFGTYFKLLLAWASIIMLDFFTDLRFEFIWSCWLMMRTVSDSFRYQGLAFALFFTVTAIMADLLCYFLVPNTLIYLLGSSCVWIQLVWQTDRGVSLQTFCSSLHWLSGCNFGFQFEKYNLTSFSNEKTKACFTKELWCYLKSDTTAKSKHSNMLCDDNNCPVLAISSSTSTVPNLTPSGHVVAEANNNIASMIHSKDKENHSNTNMSRKGVSVNHSRNTITTRGTTAHGNNCADMSLCSVDKNVSQEDTFEFRDDEQGSNHTSAAISPSEQADPYTSVSSAETILSRVTIGMPRLVAKRDRYQSSSASTCSNASLPKSCTSLSVNNPINNKTKSTCASSNTKSSDTNQSTASTSTTSTKITSVTNSSAAAGSGKSNPSSSNSLSTGCKSGGKNPNKDEYTLKLEAEAKLLKSEIQSLRSSEVNLRSQVQQLLAAERTYRSESSQAQQESESLQAKLIQLTQRLQADRANLQAAEKSLAEERKHRLLLEQQFKQQASKQTEENLAESSSSVTDNSKATDSKASMNESRNSSCELTGVEICKNSEVCAARRRELELELQNLTKALTLKDNQLSALNAERFTHGLNESSDKSWKKQTKKERTKQSNSISLEQHYNLTARRQNHEITESELNDLASRVNSLQEENQRLTDTLKEEDKMKQELMTAYHSSLKEITELNATLTKKEYQIVELNKRLNCLTPNLCEYVSRMNASVSNSAKPPNSTVLLEVTSNEECAINSYSSLGASQLYTNFNKTQIDEPNNIDRNVSNLPSSSRLNSYNHSYTMTTYEASTSMNNLSSQKNIHGISELNNSVNLNNLDYFGHCSPSNGSIPSSALTNTELSYQTNLNGHCHMNNRMHFRPDKLPHSNILFDSPGFHSNHFETLGLKCLNGGYSSYDNALLSRILPSSSMPLCSTRPLPIGSSAPAASPPPLFVPPPGLLQNDIPSNIFPYSHSVGINPTSSFLSTEVVANSSICATESMTAVSTGVNSFNPRIVADSFSSEPVQTVGINLNHHEDLSFRSHRDMNFNNPMCDDSTNTNPHSLFRRPIQTTVHTLR
ncbi:unnamed protein product [Heterobilharzia americana]|nr:unnamed protein product [Heterobilharzia americana]